MASFFDFTSLFWQVIFKTAQLYIFFLFIWLEKRVEVLEKKAELYDATAYHAAYGKRGSDK